MTKVGWTGLEGAGKSQLMAVKSCWIRRRNIKWAKKLKKSKKYKFVRRTMAFDSPMSKDFQASLARNDIDYLLFRDLSDILHLKNTDFFFNEIVKFFPSRGTEPLSREVVNFLSQGDKMGNDIFFCSQDFSQAHKHFRYLVNRLYLVRKLFGSRRPRPSAPPPLFIYGLVLKWRLAPTSYQGDNASMKLHMLNILPMPYWINKRDCMLFDTEYRVPDTMRPPVYYAQQEHIYLEPDGSVGRKHIKYVKR